MEYDYSAFSSDNAAIGGMGSMSDMGGMGGTDGMGGGMGGGTNSFGSGMGGGMGGGTNSFGSDMGGMGEGMSGDDMEELFAQSPWGGLNEVGFTSLEQVFRGNSGGNLQRSDSSFGSGVNNQAEGDPLLAGGGGDTSADPAYIYDFANNS